MDLLESVLTPCQVLFYTRLTADCLWRNQKRVKIIQFMLQNAPRDDLYTKETAE